MVYDVVVVALIHDPVVVVEAETGDLDGLNDEVVVVDQAELVSRGAFLPEDLLPAGARALSDGLELDADLHRGADFPKLAFGHGAVDHQQLQTFELLLGQPPRFESEVEAVVVVVCRVHVGKDPVPAPVELGPVGVLEERPRRALAAILDDDQLEGLRKIGELHQLLVAGLVRGLVLVDEAVRQALEGPIVEEVVGAARQLQGEPLVGDDVADDELLEHLGLYSPQVDVELVALAAVERLEPLDQLVDVGVPFPDWLAHCPLDPERSLAPSNSLGPRRLPVVFTIVADEVPNDDGVGRPGVVSLVDRSPQDLGHATGVSELTATQSGGALAGAAPSFSRQDSVATSKQLSEPLRWRGHGAFAARM